MKMTPAGLRWLRSVVFIVALVPFVRLFVLGYTGNLGANPIEFVTRSTGTWTLVFLCLTLAITPLRMITGWSWLIRLRRMLGLYAFFYGICHFTTYFWFDQWFDWVEIVKDIWKRPYITAGFAAFALMIPLAMTSNNWSMRKLGRRWSTLHRAAYLIAPLGVLHYWWHKAGKNDYFEPAIYGFIVLLLLVMRVWSRWNRARTMPDPRRRAASG